jgi:AmiR/NasT family two-component response regulator
MDRLRILIAEDETLIRLDLRGMLEAAGHEVVGEARTGVEAVTLARALEPDLAVLDVKMPELDGIEAARRILAERPLPVVVLTAYGDDRLVARAVRAGVYAYVVKPFREQDLLPAVATAFARHAEAAGRGERPAFGGLSFEVHLPSTTATGNWPLSFGRDAAGRLRVSLREGRGRRP